MTTTTVNLPQPGDKDIVVFSRSGKIRGVTTGTHRACRLEGCRGRQLTVKWENGKTTFPCTKGMEYSRNNTAWIIL